MLTRPRREPFRGYVRRQPRDELVHLGNGLGDGGHVLLAPAADLPLEVVAGLAVAGKTLLSEVHCMQGCYDAVHLVVDGMAFVIAHAGKGLVPKHPTLHEFHDVEGPSDDRFIFAEDVHAGHGHTGSMKALHDREFTLDRMG
jgi:hypothetical protein